MLLAASFPPAIGGIETLLYQTSRRLAEPPTVVAPPPAAAPDLDVRWAPSTPGMRLVYRPLWAMHPSLHFLQTFWAPAMRLARAAQPRVVMAGHVYLAPMARLLARRLHVPYVAFAYGQEVWWGGRGMGLAPLDSRLRGAALRAADRVLVPGTFTAGLLADWRVAPKRIVTVPYGAEPRQAIEPPSGSTLLSVARLVPRKGIDTVIRGLRQLPAEVTYRVVGSGPDLSRLRDVAAAEGVEGRVHFLGRIDQTALDDEYRRCAIFVLPARKTYDGQLEGYGLVYFEAAAWGRPVVAGRSGGEVDAVDDGRSGLLVDGSSVDAVAQAVRGLLAEPDRLQALGAAGRQRVQTSHNWQCAARVVDSTLAQLA